MDSRRVVVLLGMSGRRQKRIVDVRRRRAALDGRPIMVFHQNQKYRFDGVTISAVGGAGAVRCERVRRGPVGCRPVAWGTAATMPISGPRIAHGRVLDG